MYSHLWDQIRASNPDHSANYAKRWQDLASEGLDIDGEARFVSALVAPGARVLDAGCGQGRLGGYLAQRGYAVTGVDLDEYLVSEARSAFPEAEWHVGDLATFDLSVLPRFDAIVSAGNVLTFVDPDARRSVLANHGLALASEGRLVTGFGVGRGYDFVDYEEDLAAVGLTVTHRFSSWDLRSFDANSEFLVCVSERGAR